MSESKLLAFMPWLVLQESVAIGDVTFTPFSVPDGDEENIYKYFNDLSESGQTETLVELKETIEELLKYNH